MNDHTDRNFSSIEDLVWDEDFRQWVLGNDNDLDEFWNEWEAMHPEKAEELTAAKQIVRAISVRDTYVSDAEISLAIQNIMAGIAGKEEAVQESIPSIAPQRNWYKYASIAATLLIIMSVALMLFKGHNTAISYKDLVKEAGGELTEVVNANPQARMIRMADGSKIFLQKNARISFAQQFNSYTTRKIYLTGKATFEVAKNPAKPFFVYTNGLITKVLGTKFTITANESDKKATVEVLSGIVSVFSLVDKTAQDDIHSQKLNSLILTRNQKADFSKDGRTLIATVVADPVASDEKIFDTAFTDSPLRSVFKDVEDCYGIPVIYDDKVFAGRTITADLSKMTMYQKLSVICKTVNARYEIIDGKIVIYANSLQTRP